MDAKINLQQLAKTLAQKKNISQKDAEAFLRTFFDSIIQNVTDTGLVKIKGLGTFKLIDVLDRESVNVKTGERIVIPGHSKLSFAPEPGLKDLINKPFADFQTVVINEGTSIEEMEWVPEGAPSPDFSPEEERNETIEDVKDEELIPVRKIAEEPVCLYGPPPVRFDEEEAVETPKPEPEPEEKPVVKPEATEPKKPHSIGKYLVWLLCILLLCLLAFFAYRALSDSSSKGQDSEQVEPQAEAPVEETPAEA